MKIKNCGFRKLILPIVLLGSPPVLASETPLSATHTRFISNKIDQVCLGLIFTTSNVAKKVSRMNRMRLIELVHYILRRVSRYHAITRLRDALIKERRNVYPALTSVLPVERSSHTAMAFR